LFRTIPARKPRPRHGAVNVLFRRQGGAGLSLRENDHANNLAGTTIGMKKAA
jgi:hypothetical protein